MPIKSTPIPDFIFVSGNVVIKHGFGGEGREAAYSLAMLGGTEALDVKLHTLR